ncbi:hypothetical protein EDB85DRAFT_2010622 [Lactarius pseudohatsudake]|nr:hypothetical protein EDB85DRAFT_2010622 [Lactarius pseudohatsudake]
MDSEPSKSEVCERLLRLVKDLVELKLSNLRLCVASCPEIDIRAVLEPLAPLRISLRICVLPSFQSSLLCPFSVETSRERDLGPFLFRDTGLGLRPVVVRPTVPQFLFQSWRMFRNGTRKRISNFDVIGKELSKKSGVSELQGRPNSRSGML